METSSQATTRVEELRIQVEGVKGVMVDNVEKVLQRGERLDDLVDKTVELQNTAGAFQKTSTQILRRAWWRNVKTWVIIITILTIILTIIILLATGVIPT
ncbi:vesicle-associated membrane protein 8-like [Petromyzon marinus]|uniref:vesicle-associated membrane protein 8-like n=1 Tax=Petromyzon marinus TaxID=7757 RepID=UPI003F71CCB4